MPPAAITGSPTATIVGEQVDVRSRQRAVAARARDQESPHADRRAARRRARTPSSATSPSSRSSRRGRPGRRRRRRPLRRSGRPPLEESGLERRRPDHHPVGARCDGAARSRRASDSRRRPGSGDRSPRRGSRRSPSRRSAVERAVEVDDVEARRALVPGIAARARRDHRPRASRPPDDPARGVRHGRRGRRSPESLRRYVLARYHANIERMAPRSITPGDGPAAGRAGSGPRRARGRDPAPPDARRGAALPPRSLHAPGARGACAPVADGRSCSSRECRISTSPSGSRPRPRP